MRKRREIRGVIILVVVIIIGVTTILLGRESRVTPSPIPMEYGIIGERGREREYEIPSIWVWNRRERDESESEEGEMGERWWGKEEEEMMAWIVQQEIGNGSLESKRIVAQVIVNRVLDERFPNSIEEVIFQKNQFTSVSNWYNKTLEPDDETRQAVNEVLNGECEDVSMSAIYFYSPRWATNKATKYFENNLEFLFELEGHRYFK